MNQRIVKVRIGELVLRGGNQNRAQQLQVALEQALSLQLAENIPQRRSTRVSNVAMHFASGLSAEDRAEQAAVQVTQQVSGKS